MVEKLLLVHEVPSGVFSANGTPKGARRQCKNSSKLSDRTDDRENGTQEKSAGKLTFFVRRSWVIDFASKVEIIRIVLLTVILGCLAVFFAKEILGALRTGSIRYSSADKVCNKRINPSGY